MHGKGYYSSAKHRTAENSTEAARRGCPKTNKQEDGKQAPEKVKGDKEQMAVNK